MLRYRFNVQYKTAGKAVKEFCGQALFVDENGG
jgi:hypothetical protein